MFLRLDCSGYLPVVATALSLAAAGCDAGASVDLTTDETEALAVVPWPVHGNLRITEIGSCSEPFDSCWFEVHNRGWAAADLSTYTLRSPAVDPYQGVVVADRPFPLPALTVAPGAYAVVRGRINLEDTDGPRVVHVVDRDQVPSWGAGGFLELLSGGRTVDFVRWGGSAAAPTTTGAWVGASATALPPAGVYGHVIARNRWLVDTDRAADWTNRAFGTPGGRNDLTSDADADLDGIPDQAEVRGGTFAGIDLFAMGARTGRRDLFVQVDRMRSSDPGLTPRREALDRITEVFAARGIAVHFDVGDLFAPWFDPGRYNLGGGNVVDYAPAVSFVAYSEDYATFHAYKAAHLDVRLTPVVHYVLFGSSQNADGSAGSSGQAELEGNDVLITLGSWGLSTSTPRDTNLLINVQAGTLMHELGHNLGLHHGGDTAENNKPNYRSVMNYMYQLSGLSILGGREGDRYYYQQFRRSPDAAMRERCGARVATLDELEQGPAGDPARFVLDYSDGRQRDLDEGALDESAGLGGTPSAWVDYDCDGQVDVGTAFDTNGGLIARDPDNGLGTSVLEDHDDWRTLSFAFVRAWAGQGLLPLSVLPRTVDPLADDRQPRVTEDAPPPWLLQQIRAR